MFKYLSNKIRQYKINRQIKGIKKILEKLQKESNEKGGMILSY